MTLSDKQTFAVLMAELGIATGKADITKQVMAVYFEDLSNFSIEVVTEAIGRARKSEKKFPSVGLLREIANSCRPQNQQQIPRFSLADVKPNSELGKACIANIDALFNGSIDKREFLLESARIADKFNQPEIQEWVDAEWEAQPDPF